MLGCSAENDGLVDDFAAPPTTAGAVLTAPVDPVEPEAPDSGGASGDGAADGGADGGTTGDGGADGGADGGDTGDPGLGPESCSLEASGLCYELTGGAAGWCEALAASHGDTPGWFAGFCEVGAVLRCGLPAGDPLPVAVDRLYYAPVFDTPTAAEACARAGGQAAP
jgi:hypothetical protein